MYEAGGCKSAVVELDMPKARWQKLLWNGTFNTLCALMGCDVGELQSSGGRETMLVPMMYELLAIAKGADGVEFENGDGLVKTLAYGLPDDCPYRPSMLVDADHGRPMEIETILGEAVRKAKRAGVEALKCESTYNLLKVLQWKNAQKALGFNGSVGGQPDGTHLFEKKEKKNTDGGFIMSAGMEELTKAQKEETAEEA